jgi:hypothetical protein
MRIYMAGPVVFAVASKATRAGLAGMGAPAYIAKAKPPVPDLLRCKRLLLDPVGGRGVAKPARNVSIRGGATPPSMDEFLKPSQAAVGLARKGFKGQPFWSAGYARVRFYNIAIADSRACTRWFRFGCASSEASLG